MYPTFKFHLFFILFVIIIHGGCSSDTETEYASTLNHTQLGWTAYNLGNFTQSLLSFERALNSDPEFADAYNGVGWSNLSLSLSLKLSQEAFQNAVRFDPSNADAWVGLANVLYLRNRDNTDFEDSIRSIDNALQGDHKYLFRHDYQSNADLFALKAACYYYLGDNKNTKQEIENTLGIDPTNRTAIVLQELNIE